MVHKADGSMVLLVNIWLYGGINKPYSDTIRLWINKVGQTMGCKY